jgi:hypothetical protein
MPQLTVKKILWTCQRFKNYKHQLLQHVTAQDKEVHYIFCCNILSKLEDDKLSTAKISMKINCQRWPYHLVTSFPWRNTNWFLILGVTKWFLAISKGFCIHSTVAHHFAGTCWADLSIWDYSYTHHAYKYVGSIWINKYSETSIHRSRYRRCPACIVCHIWSRN